MSGPSIAIVGAGISGITLAIGLIKRGLNVKIYEQAHRFGEIGAGVAFGSNSVRAMDAVDKDVRTAYDKVSTNNLSTEKARVWFDFVDGFNNHEAEGVSQEKWLFDLKVGPGSGGAHRAQFINELVKSIPPGTTEFQKHVDTCVEHGDGMLELRFHDGTTARHDAVIGSDGIKSRVRAFLVGEDSPKAHPSYTHKYAYRGLMPMEKAVGVLGPDIAGNSHLHMGPRAHILTFPVDHGETLNVVAFKTDENEWTDARLTAHAHKADVLRDYAGWHPVVVTLLEMLNEDLDRWAIFDLGSHPLDSYYRGRICLTGDAAHATSPNHGAGAGFCIEDSAVLSELLSHAVNAAGKGRVPTNKALEAAFAAFDHARRERANWLVQSSRHCGDLYEWMVPDIGSDSDKVLADLTQRCEQVWNHDLAKATQEALADLDARLV